MRKIVLQSRDKEVPVTLQNGETQMQTSKFSDKDVISLIISGQAQKEGGYSVQEIKDLLRLVNKVDSANDGEPLLLEDSDYKLLKSKVDDFKWGAVDERIIEFVDAINNAEEVEVTEGDD